MADIDFNIDEVMRNLDLLDNRVNRGVNKVLKESAEPLKESIESMTNRSDGSTHRYDEGHAQDRVTVTNVMGGQTDEKSVDVGYEKAVAWRMYFVNFGTIYQRPQSIIQRSITAKKSEVLAKQREGMRKLVHG